MNIDVDIPFAILYPNQNPRNAMNASLGGKLIKENNSVIAAYGVNAGSMDCGNKNDAIYVYENLNVCHYQVLQNGVKIGQGIKLPGSESGAIIPGEVVIICNPIVKFSEAGWLIIATYVSGKYNNPTKKGIVYWMNNNSSSDIIFDKINGIVDLTSQTTYPAVRQQIFFFKFRWLILLDTGEIGYITIQNNIHNEYIKIDKIRQLESVVTLNNILYLAHVNRNNQRDILIDRFQVNDIIDSFSLTSGSSIVPPATGSLNVQPRITIYNDKLLCVFGGSTVFYSVASLSALDLPVVWTTPYRIVPSKGYSSSILLTNDDLGVSMFMYDNSFMLDNAGQRASNICYKLFYWNEMKWSRIEYVFSSNLTTKIDCCYTGNNWYIHVSDQLAFDARGFKTNIKTVIIPFKLLPFS